MRSERSPRSADVERLLSETKTIFGPVDVLVTYMSFTGVGNGHRPFCVKTHTPRPVVLKAAPRIDTPIALPIE